MSLLDFGSANSSKSMSVFHFRRLLTARAQFHVHKVANSLSFIVQSCGKQMKFKDILFNTVTFPGCKARVVYKIPANCILHRDLQGYSSDASNSLKRAQPRLTSINCDQLRP